MEQKEIIVCEDDYKKELRAYYGNLLKGRLLSINLSELTDEEIKNSITNYDVNENIINNFCSWITIGEIGSSEYNEHNYKFVKFLSGEDSVFDINFSQFKYPMSPLNHIGCIPYDETKVKYVCSVDGKCISPEVFFAKHKEEKLLLIYSFPAITQFNTQKKCYLFAHSKISVEDIRKYIKYAQCQTIKDIVEYPALDIPETAIKIECENWSNSPRVYGKCSTTVQFASSLFEKEFKEDFITLLNVLNQN